MKEFNISLARIFGSVLYHTTPGRRAINILREKKFYLSSSLAHASEEKLVGANMFYLSMARSLRSAYIQQEMTRHQAIIVLDAHLLSQRYRIRPVSYYGRGVSDEMEDRLISTHPTIPALPYIKEIWAVASGHDTRNLAAACKSRKIPILVFNSIKSLMLGKKEDTVDVSHGPGFPEKTKHGRLVEKEPWPLNNWLLLFDGKPQKADEIKRLLAEYDKNPKETLPKLITRLDQDILGSKVNAPKEVARFSQILRKNRWGLEDFVKHIVEKKGKP